MTSTNFSIPIFYTPAETNVANRIINVTLFSPNPLAITNGFPKTATVTILDNQLVTGAPGTVDPTLQTGIGFNGVMQSLSMQPDGKVLAAGDFSFVNNYPFQQRVPFERRRLRGYRLPLRAGRCGWNGSPGLSQTPGGWSNGRLHYRGR